MRLYHFIPTKWGIVALKNRRLKIGIINELNDPFEFLGWNSQRHDVRAILNSEKSKLNKHFGIVCFSRKWTNPLLWSHYADKHQGIAIGFEVPDGPPFYRVNYSTHRLPVPTRVQNKDVDDLLLTKFEAWEYESEHRCFCQLSTSIKDGEYYFEPFSERLKLTQIIVGSRSDLSRAELAEVLGDEYAHVSRFKARPAFNSFSVVRNRNDLLWQ